MMKPRPELKIARKAAHEARKADWQTLSPKEQLAALDARLGKGQGAKKQRARLAKALLVP